MAAPAALYLQNLMLGTNVIEASRLAGVDKTVVVGTICSYPKHTPVPFQETSLWEGYPEETNAPYGVAKLAHLVHLQRTERSTGNGAPTSCRPISTARATSSTQQCLMWCRH